jgi:hypothetical protein
VTCQWHDKTRQDKARQGKARQGKARQGKTWIRSRVSNGRNRRYYESKTGMVLDNTRQDQDNTKEDKTRQDKTRQDKKAQGKTRQDKDKDKTAYAHIKLPRK